MTTPYRLQPHRRAYPLENYFLWAITETPFGKWRREFLIDPLLYLRSKVHWRNYEAGYDVAELEPPSRKHRTYVLQEYFVPVERFDEFVPKMAEIFQRHRVNVLNVSIRHAMPDPGSLLAWARTETFAFVVYYKQRTRENARQRVAVWTRELIDAALSVGGSLLPAVPAARHARAVPSRLSAGHRAVRAEAHARPGVPPAQRAVGQVLRTHPSTDLAAAMNAPISSSEFHAVYDDVKWRDAFYRFLQNVYRIFPEDRFHTLIKQACDANRRGRSDLSSRSSRGCPASSRSWRSCSTRCLRSGSRSGR